MILCKPHWRHLQFAIGSAGLDGLVAETRFEQMARNQSRVDTETIRLDNFDPVIMADHLCKARAIGTFGDMITTPHPDGSYLCPACEMNHCYAARTPHAGDDMIDEQVQVVRSAFLRLMAHQS